MIKDVIFFPNGNTAVCDEHGQQVPQLQEPWILLYVQKLINEGADPLTLNILMPNGRSAKLFKIPDGWNWRINA